MIFDIRARQTGKTRDLLDRKINMRGVLLVPNMGQAQEVMQQYYPESRGYHPEDYGVFTADRWMKFFRYGKTSRPIYIDNVDMILRDLLGDVRIVTATSGEDR